MTIKVVTNNPKVLDYTKKHSINVIHKTYIPEVLEETRNLIHKNFKLINHPLTTSIKPYSNLYKTVVLAEGDELDFQSLSIIENAIERIQVFQKIVQVTEQSKTDYQMIDFGVFQQIIESNLEN